MPDGGGSDDTACAGGGGGGGSTGGGGGGSRGGGGAARAAVQNGTGGGGIWAGPRRQGAPLPMHGALDGDRQWLPQNRHGSASAGGGSIDNNSGAVTLTALESLASWQGVPVAAMAVRLLAAHEQDEQEASDQVLTLQMQYSSAHRS